MERRSIKKNPSLSKSNQPDEEEKESESKMIYDRALENFKNKAYKKTIKYIESVTLFEETFYYWQILYLKLCSYISIIEKKLLKYYSSIKLINVEKYFRIFNKEIQVFIKHIQQESIFNDDDIYYPNKIECLITLILKQCHNCAKYCIYQNLIFDCVGFLGLADRLIKNTSNFFISPDSYHQVSSIYIFLSSIYIVSENYETAKRYIILCLKITLKELELRLGHDNYRQTLINLSLDKIEEEILEKIFLNLTICFYHLGVCNENEYDFDSAYQSYKQAKWFGKVITNDDMIEFLVTIYNMEKRELLRYQMFDFFKNEANNIFEEPKKVKKKPKYLFDEEDKIKKFEKLQTFLENLKIPEIDDEEPDLLNKVNQRPYSSKVIGPTKTIHVLNFLMEKKFNDVIYKMKKIEINRLKKPTKDIIQKQIIKMKNDEREKISKREKENERKKLIQSQQILNKQQKINETNNYINKDIDLINIRLNPNNKFREPTKVKINNYTYTNNYNTTRTSNSNNSLLKNNITNTLYNNNNSIDYSNNSALMTSKYNTLYTENNNCISLRKNRSTLKSSEKKENKIKKINYDFYVFNKKFRLKQSFLDQQFSRECQFQKNLLASKNNEPFDYVESFNKRKVFAECDDFFNTNLIKEMKFAKERLLIKEEQNKKTKNEMKALNIFKDVNGIVNFFKKNIKRKKKKSLSPQSKNMQFIDNLTSKIEEIDNIKNVLKSSYKRNLKKERNKSARPNYK